MPISWTAEKNQLLLVLMLDCCKNMTIDYDGIIAAWPDADKPSKKALTEHFAKLRRNVKAATGGAGFTASKGKAAATTKKSAPSPRSKPIPAVPKITKAKASKRNFLLDQDEDECDELPMTNHQDIMDGVQSTDKSPRRQAAINAGDYIKQEADLYNNNNNSPAPHNSDDDSENEFHDSDEELDSKEGVKLIDSFFGDDDAI